MLPAPTQPFDVPTWSQAKVHPDHHVQAARALYSVPTRYVGRQVDVRIDRSTVRIYSGGSVIKVHPRVSAGKRSTDSNDYPTERSAYALRRVDALISAAGEKGEHVGRFAKQLLEGPIPWIRMRHGYALIRLCDRYSDERVDALCERSLAFGVLDVGRIEAMLKKAHRIESDGMREGRVVPLPPSRFARDPSSFATRAATRTPSEGGAS